MKKLPRNSLPRLTLQSKIWIGDLVRMRYVLALMPEGSNACLDAGCGVQCLYKNIVEQKGYSWHGIDLKPSSFGILGDLRKLPFKKDYFQAILCVDVLEHIREFKQALTEFWRVLIDNGILVLHTPNLLQTPLLIEPVEPDDHVRRGFTPLQLRRALTQVGFVNQEFKYTFNWNEAIVWDYAYANLQRFPVDLDYLLNFSPDDFQPYGTLSIWQKKRLR